MAYDVERTESEWRAVLAPEEFRILRQAGTEPAFTGALNDEWRGGEYRCRGCERPLFAAATKFDAGCGWPSFWEPLREGAVEYVEDLSFGMRRVEVRCAGCGGHLGHVFPDGHGTPTGNRFCMNSASLEFVPDDDASGEG
ncbi:MAG: peptide-methionine (R)-S-oxide reductase MsrB [Microbacteriaceae bacterium]|nr:peptide-methionine (R)-S-oxide reductase MsrB [Microbacteriaceae bacterium]